MEKLLKLIPICGIVTIITIGLNAINDHPVAKNTKNIPHFAIPKPLDSTWELASMKGKKEWIKK